MAPRELGRFAWRIGAVLVVMTAVMVGAASSASAHALLDSTSPAEGSTVEAPPKAITLTFSEGVEVSLGAIRLFDASGREVELPKATHPEGRAEQVRVEVPRLGRGTYVVDWRVISADSHPINGAFTFDVVAPSDAEGARGLLSRLVNDQGSQTVGVLFAAVRWLGYATVAFVFGGLIFVGWIWPGGPASRRARRTLVASAWVGVAAALLAIAFQGAYAGGFGIGHVLRPSLWGDVVGTRFGQAHLVQAVAMVAAAMIAARVGSARAAWWQIATMTVGLVLAAAVTFSGHGDTGRWRGVAIAADLVHVGAFSVWIGGLCGLLLWGLRTEHIDDGVVAARRFSAAAMASVVMLALSGLVQGIRQVGSTNALVSSTYGRLLMVKVGIVLVTVGVAWVSRALVRELAGVGSGPGSTVGLVDAPDQPTDAEPDDEETDDLGGGDDEELPEPDTLRRYLRRSVGVEVFGVVAVLVVSTLLSSVIPARETVAIPFNQTVVTDQGFAQFSVDPARTGSSAIHVTITNADGTVPDIAELTVELNLPEREIGPLEVPMTALSSNHFVNEHASLPVPGRWRMTATARVGEFDQMVFNVDVPINA